MRFAVASSGRSLGPRDVVVVPVFAQGKGVQLKPLARIARLPGLGAGRRAADGAPGRWRGILAGSGFCAKAGTVLAVPCPWSAAGWVLLAGMGPAAEVGLQGIRAAAAAAARQLRTMQAARVQTVLPDAADLNFADETFVRCWAEGALMALSPTGELKTGRRDGPAPHDWTLVAAASRLAAARAALREAEAMAAGCLFARYLVNLPPNILTPAELAERARRMARRHGLTCRVLGGAALRKLGMGGLLAVGRGSEHAPRLIVVDYRGGRGARVPKIALVGKGITFDSGGLSLKPSQGMDEMKCDMAGAAGVLGAAMIAARLRLPVRLRVVVPAAENMPDGGAVRPSDVVTMADGQTVEVLNTDAEGRLILADALWYAQKSKPDYLIDMATLTGACVVALGPHFAGLLGNSAELIDTLKQAGGETGERVWHLPLVDEHKELMKGVCADLQNIGGGREGGALTAAAFLAAFVDAKTRWCHLDIAGPAYSDRVWPTSPKGATGFGARLLARALQILAD